MPTRLTAIAHLTTELASVTLTMGQLLVRTQRDRTTMYEDSF